MANCLYCGREAGAQGFHLECIPEATPRATAVVEPASHATPEARRAAIADRLRAAPSEITATPGLRSGPASVRVVDVDMPFGSMVVFMVKWALASIPALIILLIVGAFVAGVARALVGR